VKSEGRDGTLRRASLRGLLACEAGFEDALWLVFADLDGVGIGGVDREFAFGILHAGGVEDLFGLFVDDLEDGVFEVDVIGEVSGRFPAIVVAGVEIEGPAGELGILVLGDVGEAFEALEGDLAGLLVEVGEAIAVGALGFVFAVGGVGVGEHRDFVTEAIEVISGPREGGIWNGVGSGFGVGGMPPATVDGVDESGGGEGVGAVVELIDAVANGDAKVLITAEVGGVGAADFAEGVVASSLGPGVGVEVGEEAVGGGAVDVDGAAEGGLREDHFEVGSGPVLRPIVEELELAVAEEFEAFDVDGFPIVFGVVDVVGARAHFRDGALRAGFEFAVFEDREGNAGVGQVGEIDANSALDRLGIDGVGEVPGLLALDHVDVSGCVVIATAGAGGVGRLDAFFTPEVGLADVVIIGNGDGGAVTHDVAELHPELEPARGVLGVMVGLVARKEEDVGILRDEVFDNQRAGAGGAR